MGSIVKTMSIIVTPAVSLLMAISVYASSTCTCASTAVYNNGAYDLKFKIQKCPDYETNPSCQPGAIYANPTTKLSKDCSGTLMTKQKAVCDIAALNNTTRNKVSVVGANHTHYYTVEKNHMYVKCSGSLFNPSCSNYGD